MISKIPFLAFSSLALFSASILASSIFYCFKYSAYLAMTLAISASSSFFFASLSAFAGSSSYASYPSSSGCSTFC
jgi:hypothetical protein